MRVLEFRARGWRNLVDGLHVIFPVEAGLNVLFGDNAQGKTNVLEAVHYLSAFRSFRTSQSADLVRTDADRCSIETRLATGELERTVEVRLARHPAGQGVSAVGRTILVDGKAVRSAANAFGTLGTVLFVPEDLGILRASPSARRRFLDFAVSAVNRGYFGEAAEFQKVLRSRNAVLRGRPAVAGAPGALLDTYDEELARTGARVVERRRRLLEALAPRAGRFFSTLHGALEVGFAYVAAPEVARASTESEVAGALLAGVRGHRSQDLRRGHSTFGPHLDDFEVTLEGRPAREHASQGQLRSLVLAMKLGELVNVEAVTGDAPVLLLDDVPSELDPARRSYLFGTLGELGCQTILTVSDRTLVPSSDGRADFRVEGGRVTPER